MMKTLLHILVFFSFCCALPAMEVPHPTDVQLEQLPAGMKNSWQQLGSIELTFSAAIRKFGYSLVRNGWKQNQAFCYDEIQKKQFEVWSKDKISILLHFWRISPDKTGFSWGALDEKFVKQNIYRKVKK